MKYNYHVEKDNYSDAGKVSSSIKQILKQMGMDVGILRRIAIACYEAEINMIIHSFGGDITMSLEADGELKIIFQDCGPGIEDVEKAMQPGYSTANEKAREFGFGAGMGLVNIKRVSDIFDLKTSSHGTTLTIGFHIL